MRNSEDIITLGDFTDETSPPPPPPSPHQEDRGKGSLQPLPPVCALPLTASHITPSLCPLPLPCSVVVAIAPSSCCMLTTGILDSSAAVGYPRLQHNKPSTMPTGNNPRSDPQARRTISEFIQRIVVEPEVPQSPAPRNTRPTRTHQTSQGTRKARWPKRR